MLDQGGRLEVHRFRRWVSGQADSMVSEDGMERGSTVMGINYGRDREVAPTDGVTDLRRYTACAWYGLNR